MNIFVTSDCPWESAHALDDKRIVKMVLESAQILCTVLRRHGVEDSRLYRATHANHPCTLWAGETRDNFDWLLDHFVGLGEEYNRRYNKRHASMRLFDALCDHADSVPEGARTPFANAARNRGLGVDFTGYQSVFQAYRRYLEARWKTDKRAPKWTSREAPTWADV